MVHLVEAPWVRFAMGSVGFFIDLILRGCTNAVGVDSACYINDRLAPWSRALLEKLTIFQLIKKFPAFYGT